MKARDLEALTALAEAKRGRDLARLEALIVEGRRLEEEIAELARTERRDAAEGADLAQLARRLAWAEAGIAARRRRMAAIAGEIAAVRAEARVSLGKHEARKVLLARAEREARTGRERAEEIAALVGRPAGRDRP